jgi:hypothetical protein
MCDGKASMSPPLAGACSPPFATLDKKVIQARVLKLIHLRLTRNRIHPYDANRFNTYEERFSPFTAKERAIGFSFPGNAGFKLEL